MCSGQGLKFFICITLYKIIKPLKIHGLWQGRKSVPKLVGEIMISAECWTGFILSNFAAHKTHIRRNGSILTVFDILSLLLSLWFSLLLPLWLSLLMSLWCSLLLPLWFPLLLPWWCSLSLSLWLSVLLPSWFSLLLSLSCS